MAVGCGASGKTTMQDIADHLGISKVSVSKAMNMQKGVSEELRKKIFLVAEELGYARVLNEGHCSFAFVVTKKFFLDTDGFYSEMYYYFDKYCLAEGHKVTMFIVNSTDEKEAKLPQQLVREPFDGIAVAGEIRATFLQKLGALGKPIVLMDFSSDLLSCSSILTDNYHWGYKATQYLIEKGHKKIGFVGDVGVTASITDRYFGYRRALLLHDLPYNKAWKLVNNNSDNGLYYTNIDLPEDMPTAFVCHCDMAAHFLINAFEMHGLHCPEDVSAISFDNTKLANTNRPPLTSINIDIRTFARQAIDDLVGIIHHNRQAPVRSYIPSNLVERASIRDMNL